jgi:hypothetical protein
MRLHSYQKEGCGVALVVINRVCDHLEELFCTHAVHSISMARPWSHFQRFSFASTRSFFILCSFTTQKQTFWITYQCFNVPTNPLRIQNSLQYEIDLNHLVQEVGAREHATRIEYLLASVIRVWICFQEPWSLCRILRSRLEFWWFSIWKDDEHFSPRLLLCFQGISWTWSADNGLKVSRNFVHQFLFTFRRHVK